MAGPSVRTPEPDPGAASAAPVSTAEISRVHTAAVAVFDGLFDGIASARLLFRGHLPGPYPGSRICGHTLNWPPGAGEFR
ncbi:hypothetical protein [Streptomyces sp. BRA346]|uniref:hypothetical protein n=1 Tax=Streptomyces sp. BRA346 TaxID=2878199 RepID=UPI0040648185